MTNWTLGPAESALEEWTSDTVWSAGIPGGIPNYTTIHTTIDAETYGDGETDATTVINNAIAAAGATAESSGIPQVVYIPAGVYKITAAVELDVSHVVVRGDGMTSTYIKQYTESTPVFSVNYEYIYPSVVSVVGTVARGSTTVEVSSATTIQVGDVLQIDQLDDDSYVEIGDCNYYKRVPGGNSVGPASPGGYRSVTQQIEVTAKNGNILTIKDPVYIAFESDFDPEVYKTATVPRGGGEIGIHYSGIEEMYVTGGTSHMIDMSNVAYCWVKNVHSDGTLSPGLGMGGHHVELLHGYRCEIRGSYFHDAVDINPGGGAYGVVLSSGTSNCLIEDNIMYHLNKPLVSNCAGGGNIVSYNYIDEAIVAAQPTWQEQAIDSHCSFPQHTLYEGNWASCVGNWGTHGNAGWQYYFRNYVRGRNSSDVTTGHVDAVSLDTMSKPIPNYVIGNVLMESHPVIGGKGPYYEHTEPDPDKQSAACVYRLGGWDTFDDGSTLAYVVRHANYDYVTETVIYKNGENQNLPDSLYLGGKPSFFGSSTWPWVTPSGSTKYYTLPAKERFDAM